MDSGEAIFICRPTVAACETDIRLMRYKGDPIQPFIIIIGDSIFVL